MVDTHVGAQKRFQALETRVLLLRWPQKSQEGSRMGEGQLCPLTVAHWVPGAGPGLLGSAWHAALFQVIPSSADPRCDLTRDLCYTTGRPCPGIRSFPSAMLTLSPPGHVW